MKFNQLFIAAMALGATFTAQAQDVVVVNGENMQLIQEGKTLFEPHWFMQIQGGAAYTTGENKFDKLISPAATVNIGYKFSPVFGIRVGASGWQGKGSWVSPRVDYKYKYIQGNLDAMLDLSNLFCGFNPTRVFDAYGFLGAGFNHTFDNGAVDAENGKNVHFLNLWQPKHNSVVGRGGLGVNLRLSDHVAINVEANANMLTDRFNSKKGSKFDWQFNALVGLTVKFGKGYKQIPPVYAAVEEVVEEIIEPEPVEETAPEPEPAPVVKPEPYRCDIFFIINSAKIRPAEQPKIDDLVAYLKANPESKVDVTGYADRATGTSTYNMQISKRRADAVANALKAAGIDAQRITASAKGDTVQPFTNIPENRVVISIAD